MSSNKFNFISQHSINDQADYIADFLPDDETFEGKTIANTSIRKILEVFGVQLKKLEEFINIFSVETDPSCAENLLEEWEKMLGIPDDCYLVENETLEDRQRNALIKLSKMSVQTNQDFENLANSFGITATVQSGIDFVNAGGAPFAGGDMEARFTVVITFEEAPDQVFPLTFPILFGSSILGILECVFRKVLPANCNAKFIVNIPEALGDFYFSLNDPATPLRNAFFAGAFGQLDTDISIEIGDTITLSYGANFQPFNGNFIQSADGLSFAGFDGSRDLGIAGFTATLDDNPISSGYDLPKSEVAHYPIGGAFIPHVIVLTATTDNDIRFIGESGINTPVFDVTIVTSARTYFYPINTGTIFESDSNGSGNNLTISSNTTINNFPYYENNGSDTSGIMPYIYIEDPNANYISNTMKYGQPSLRLDGSGACLDTNGATHWFGSSLENIPFAYKDGFTIEATVRYIGNANSNGRTCGVVSSCSNSFSVSLWALGFDNYDGTGTGGTNVVPAFSLLKRNTLYNKSADFTNNIADVRGVAPVVSSNIYHLLATIRQSDNSIEFWVNGISQGSQTITQPEMDAWLFGALAEFGAQDVKNGVFGTRIDIGARLTNGTWRTGQDCHIQDVKIHLLEADDAFAVNQASFANFT